MRDRIFVSFSGGRSSALMCKLVQERYLDAEKVFLFANTGEEHPATLEFVDKCDKHFGLNLIWIEAQVHEGERRSTTHRVVDFATASRDGRPFEDVVRKYGVPNNSYPHCTRELKTRPMYSYIHRHLGWEQGSYRVAIGIRADEPRRIAKDAASRGLFYPLAEAGVDKADVLEFWEGMPFRLDLPEHHGNCKTCWKKSDTKHVLNIKEHREWYAFFDRLEREYGTRENRAATGCNVFFYKRRSTAQMLALADAVESPSALRLNRPDEDAGCSESCEVEFE